MKVLHPYYDNAYPRTVLAVLSDCRDLVPKHYGAPLDYAQIPQDDAVYKTIAEADTKTPDEVVVVFFSKASRRSKVFR